ncbi:MAG: calcium-binding protein [Microvirga sp.]
MAQFSLSSTAGYGISMSPLLEAAFGFADDRSGLSFQLNPPAGPFDGTASWNIHGGAADTMSATYRIDGTGAYEVQAVTFGGLPLVVSGLSLAMARGDFEAGSWILRLNEGDDRIDGTNYADVIHAGTGNDIVHGYDGSDVITGFDGSDTLDGGAGNDILSGGTGSDVLSGGIGHNHLDGGSGWDFAWLQGSRDDYTFARQADGSIIAQNGTGSSVDTLVNIEALRFSDGSGIDIATLFPGSASGPTNPGPVAAGGSGPSTAPHAALPVASLPVEPAATESWIFGLWWPDRLQGADLNDHIFGRFGNDWLYGGAGNDWLHGEAGRDHLFGGTGRDAFVFDRKARPGNVDKIVDFSVRDDTIWIENAVFRKVGPAGVLKKGAFWTGEAAHDAGDRVIYDRKTGALSYDRDGTGDAQPVQFAQLSKNLKLTHLDFLVI